MEMKKESIQLSNKKSFRGLIIFYGVIWGYWLLATGIVGWNNRSSSFNGIASFFITVCCICMSAGIYMIFAYKKNPSRSILLNVVGYLIFVPPALILTLATILLLVTPAHL
ncbi:hypothetical protein ACLBWT_19015 [Paenibacillus sp. D51F]